MASGLCGGLFIANLTVTALMWFRFTHGLLLTPVQDLQFRASLLCEAKWKESIGIANMMTLASLACIVVALILIVAIRFCFYRDHERATQERLLESFRGRPAGDVEAAAEAIMAVTSLLRLIGTV